MSRLTNVDKLCGDIGSPYHFGSGLGKSFLWLDLKLKVRIDTQNYHSLYFNVKYLCNTVIYVNSSNKEKYADNLCLVKTFQGPYSTYCLWKQQGISFQVFLFSKAVNCPITWLFRGCQHPRQGKRTWWSCFRALWRCRRRGPRWARSTCAAPQPWMGEADDRSIGRLLDHVAGVERGWVLLKWLNHSSSRKSSFSEQS